VVEGARLESVYTRKGIKGSNPFLSADEMNVPDFIGAFLFVADGTGLPGPDAENKNGSERSERAFI